MNLSDLISLTAGISRSSPLIFLIEGKYFEVHAQVELNSTAFVLLSPGNSTPNPWNAKGGKDTLEQDQGPTIDVPTATLAASTSSSSVPTPASVPTPNTPETPETPEDDDGDGIPNGEDDNDFSDLDGEEPSGSGEKE